MEEISAKQQPTSSLDNLVKDTATAMYRMMLLLGKHLYANRAGLENTYIVARENGELVGELYGKFYTVHYKYYRTYDINATNLVLEYYVDSELAVAEVMNARAQTASQSTQVLAINVGLKRYHIPPRNLEDVVFLLLNQHIIEELEGIPDVDPLYVSLFNEISSRMMGRTDACRRVLDELVKLGQKIDGNHTARFELGLHYSVLRKLGLKSEFHAILPLEFTNTMYYVWVYVDGDLEKLMSESHTGLAVILRSVVPARELSRALRVLEKVEVATLVSPALLSAYWKALEAVGL